MASGTRRAVTFVTGNPNKLREVLEICGDEFPLQIISKQIHLDEYQEESAEDICRRKTQLAARLVGGPVIVEDTSLEIDCLAGLPGPYIKWFEERIGNEGLFRMVSAWEDRSASAVCLLGYSPGPRETECSDSEIEVKIFKGVVRGTIVPPAGDPKVFGFGFDFSFQPEGYDKTYAQLGAEIKQSISHRYRAIHAFKQHFS